MSKTMIVAAAAAMVGLSGLAVAGPAKPDRQQVIDHWTSARRAAAIPRDFYLDKQGQAFTRGASGQLVAYGNRPAKQLRGDAPTPQAKPGGGGSDSTPPSISGMMPADGATIGSAATFSAVVTDASGIRSVSFVVTYPNGTQTQSFSPSYIGDDTYSIDLSGFTDGQWSWEVVAKDSSRGGGNTATSPAADFTVDTGGGNPDPGGDVVVNSPWTGGGTVQTAAGRIYFEMPANSRRRRWAGYVCSGTVATDATSGRSVILTAAHCVYDDSAKAFARNVLFIPNQDGTSGSGTDTDCSNDPLGCWVTSFGVVDVNWTTRTFPDNIPWDYAFYVVADSGAHSGTSAGTDVLEDATGTLPISFATPYFDDGDPSPDSIDYTHALGYSYSDDPNFMYCAEDMTTEGSDNWWLPSCGLSGGSSGGPWMQPVDGGNGTLVSVNSWGYTDSPGMAGPMLSGTSAECLFTEAKGLAFSAIPSTDGDEGAAISCP